MTTVATPTMSYVFQSAPPQVEVHKLPRRAKFFTYAASDHLTISAWMPDGFDSVSQEIKETNDQFYHNYCGGCERNCHDYLQEYMDEDGEIDDYRLGPHCFVYEDGYHGQGCPEGNEKQDEEITFDIADMVFEIDLNITNRRALFSKVGDSAYLSAGYVDDSEEGEPVVFKTYNYSASNVFGSASHPEAICWGSARRPENLREIVTNYAATPFNNDLTKIPSFGHHCDLVREQIASDNYEVASQNFLCEGNGVDALLMLDAEKNIPAFFTMLCAGFKSLPELPHIMLIGATEATLERGGAAYQGYLTIPDAVGKQWFVSKDLQLVGQV